MKRRCSYDKITFLEWAAESAVGRPFDNRYPVYIYDTISRGIYV